MPDPTKSSKRIALILPAAGQSQRFGSTCKLAADLSGQSVLVRSLACFQDQSSIKQILIAAPPDDDAFEKFVADWTAPLAEAFGDDNQIQIIRGGRTDRWQTIQHAMTHLHHDITHVAVHDAARPLTSSTLIEQLFDIADAHDAVIPVMPISQTIKRLTTIKTTTPSPSHNAQRVEATVGRDHLYTAQTPQIFERSLLQRAYDQIDQGRIDPTTITDDAGLVESLGEPVTAIPGDPYNLKITTPNDLPLAQAMLIAQADQA